MDKIESGCQIFMFQEIRWPECWRQEQPRTLDVRLVNRNLGSVEWPIGVSEMQAGAAAKARGARESKPPSIRRTRRLHAEAPSLLYSTKGSEYRALGSQLCFMEPMR